MKICIARCLSRCFICILNTKVHINSVTCLCLPKAYILHSPRRQTKISFDSISLYKLLTSARHKNMTAWNKPPLSRISFTDNCQTRYEHTEDFLNELSHILVFHPVKQCEMLNVTAAKLASVTHPNKWVTAKSLLA